MLNKKTNQKGFTLVEILVAMAIFSIIMVLLVGGLRAMVVQYENTKKAQVDLINAQRAVLKISQDALQIVYRSKLSNQGNKVPTFAFGIDNDSFEFITASWHNLTAQKRSKLSLVKYHVIGEELIRSHWNTLDGIVAEDSQDRVWLAGVEAFKVLMEDSENRKTTNLKAVHHLNITLKTKTLGNLQYLIPMPYHDPIS